MANSFFNFKEFTIYQDKAAFKVGTDGVLLGASANLEEVKRILDVGSGTGLIAIMLAQRCGAEITAIEPDYYSFVQCVENVSLCTWKDRIRVENLAIQDYHPSQLFDLVIANPPYFSESLKNPDRRKSAARHDDSLSRNDLLNGVSRLLTETGRLQVIMSYAEGSLLIAEASGYGLFCNHILKIRPMPASEIRRLILTFSRERMTATEKFLTIEHGKRHEFTMEYKDLTKDFYIKF
jgi:tRNA1Val (adenine37-N6)-methyltransferase